MDGGTVRRVVYVDGQVQGVGFRWWVSSRAVRLGLAGEATNLPDGRVRVDAQGPRAAVEELVALLIDRPGPSGRPGHVTGHLVEARSPLADRHGFDTW